MLISFDFKCLSFQQTMWSSGEDFHWFMIQKRYLEFSEVERLASLVKTKETYLAWTAFSIFNRGPSLVLAGVENQSKSPINQNQSWEHKPLESFLTRLFKLKKQLHGVFSLIGGSPCILATWEDDASCVKHLGIFNVQNFKGKLKIPLPDGEYEDVLNSTKVSITNGGMEAPDSSAVFTYKQLSEYSFLR